MPENLWKKGGSPTSYNPLPLGWDNNTRLPIGDFIFTFKAKSTSLARLRVVDTATAGFTINEYINLTSEFKVYSFSFSTSASELFGFNDVDSRGDIQISDIRLVRKPLPKQTINGIDGFRSGKWSLHPEAIVIDDETLELNATAAWRLNDSPIYPVIVGQTYSLFLAQKTGGNGYVEINQSDDGVNFSGMNSLSSGYDTTGLTFTPTKKFVRIRFSANSAGKYTFKRPMFILGSTPAPYEPKRGEKMVLPIPKKNLLPPIQQWQDSSIGNGVIKGDYDVTINANISGSYFKYFVPVKPLKSYRLSGVLTFGLFYCYLTNSTKTRISSSIYSESVINTTADTMFLEVIFNSDNTSSSHSLKNFQLEESSTPTPFQPYAVQLRKKAKQQRRVREGLQFNGQTDWLRFAAADFHLRMSDFVFEFKFKAKSLTFIGTSMRLIDKTNGNFAVGLLPGGQIAVWLGTWYYSTAAITINKDHAVRVERKNQKYIYFYLDGVLSNVVEMPAPFDIANAGVIDVGSSSGSSGNFNGVISQVKISSDGVTLFEPDLTNPAAIVGDKVLTDPKQLIPSFEDPRWSLHANFKVLSKDAGQLDATSGGNKLSFVQIDVMPNTDYLVNVGGNGTYVVTTADGITNLISWKWAGSQTVFNSGANTILNIYLGNYYGTSKNGVFDLIKPQLFKLTGKEGQIFGAPVSLVKKAKRSYVSKR